MTSFLDIISESDDVIYYRVYAKVESRKSNALENNVQISDCIGQISDQRNNINYNIVEIGSQCWMAENLNYAIGNSWCYDDNPANCDTYGRLYDWETMMNGASSSNTIPSGINGICPYGWHVPSDAKWAVLEGFADTQYGISDPIWDSLLFRGLDAARNLKSKDESGMGFLDGSDSFGFNALSSGHRTIDGDFKYVGTADSFWSCSHKDDTTAWHRGFVYNYDGSYRFNSNRVNGFSLRCLRDY